MLHAGQEGNPSSRKTRALLGMTANGAAAMALLLRHHQLIRDTRQLPKSKANDATRRNATRHESWHGESPAMA
jgi:hypothetical protein